MHIPADPATRFGAPVDLAFDKTGNLWAANFQNSQLTEFTPAQLAARQSLYGRFAFGPSPTNLPLFQQQESGPDQAGTPLHLLLTLPPPGPR